MKIFKRIVLFATVALVHFSCQRELYFDGVSTGELKKDLSGNCLPFKVNGVYHIDSSINNNNYIDVQVRVSFPGTYDIGSDTVNGYFFHQSGKVERGESTIRLIAGGKPLKEGVNCFTIKYGTSTCNLCIKTSGRQPAIYTLAGSPNGCTGIFVDGSYTAGKALSASNILKVQADVTEPGSYTITATTTNGFSFSGAGVFTTKGLQDVYLKGTGTPIRAEISPVIVNGQTSACSAGVKVLSEADGKAIFSFDGSPGSCINFTINGNYYASIVTDITNTITMTVDVTKPGTYVINTNLANGISFSDAGTFTTVGPHTVTLMAKGVPVRQELTSFIPNTGTVSCNFNLNVEPLPPPAVFTLSGAPGTCSPATVNGFYILSKPLDAANTVLIQANVTTPGSYTVSTNTVNGMSFTASGVFTGAGLQNIILRGSGVPNATGQSTITPSYGASACSFTVTVQ